MKNYAGIGYNPGDRIFLLKPSHAWNYDTQFYEYKDIFNLHLSTNFKPNLFGEKVLNACKIHPLAAY